MDLPTIFQDRVREFLIFTQGTKSEQDQLKAFLEMISPSLQEKVSILIFSKVIQKNRIFNRVFQNKKEELSKAMNYHIEL